MTTTMIWLRRLGQNRMLDFGAAVIVLLSVWRIILMLPSRVYTYDFNHYYVSSRLLLDGKNPYTTPLEPLSKEFGFERPENIPTATNPPGLLWLFAPFALSPPPKAFALWTGVQALSLCAILWMTRHLLRDRLSARGWKFLCAAVLSSAPVFWHFRFSHVELLLAAAVLAAYACHRTGRDIVACLIVATAAVVKLYPLALLPWFVWRSNGDVRRRFLVGTLASGFVVTFMLLTKAELWRDFLVHGLPVVRSSSIGHTFNSALPSFVATVGRIFSGSVSSSDNVWWLGGVLAGLMLIALGYAVCAFGTGDREMEFCLLCSVMLAGGITAWGYYFVFAIFPVAVMAVRLATSASVTRVLCFSLVLLLLNSHGPWRGVLFDESRWLKIIATYIPLYGLIALCGIFGHNLLRIQTMGSRQLGPREN